MGKKQTKIGIDPTTAASFWQRNERVARYTALGIGVLIASGGAAVATSAINDGLAGGSFLLLVAVGVLLILTPRLGQQHQHKHRRVPIAPDTRALAKQERLAYQRAHTIGLVFGIGMCIASPAAAAITNSDIGGALFMFGEAIGVFFIVYVNLVAAGYKRLTHAHAKLR